MNSLCASWLFWFVVLGGFAVAVNAAFFTGWFLGVSSGQRRENVKWEARVRALHAKWEREANESKVSLQSASESARMTEDRNTGERRTP